MLSMASNSVKKKIDMDAEDWRLARGDKPEWDRLGLGRWGHRHPGPWEFPRQIWCYQTVPYKVVQTGNISQEKGMHQSTDVHR